MPNADPQLLCMAAEAGNGEHQVESCTCVTEQGTRYKISDGECRRVARHGQIYNPYHERAQAVANAHQDAAGGRELAPYGGRLAR